MPDFEALIKQQQLKSNPADKRLTIVEPINSSFKAHQPNTLNNLLFCFLGFITGGSLIVFLYLNNSLEFYINKITSLL